MRGVAVFTLVCVMSLPVPGLGQTLQSAIDRAVATELAAQGAGSGPIPSKLLWSGVGLLGLGAWLLAEGASIPSCVNAPPGASCSAEDRQAFLAAGAVAAAFGAALLIVGNAKRRGSPQILAVPGGLGVKQAITF